MSLAGDARSQGVVASPQLQRPAPGDAREHRYVENADGDDGLDGRADDEADAARPGSIARSKDAHAAPACTGVLIRRRGCADADWPARRKGPPETSRSPPQTPARSRHSARRSDRAARWPGTPTVPG